MTEAARYRDRDVCVVGANSAGQGRSSSRYVRKVTMLLRAPDLAPMMSQYLVDRIRATPNIEVIGNAEVAGVVGEGQLEAVTIKRRNSDQQQTISLSAMFIFIGVQPHTGAFAGLVERDDSDFILTGVDLPQEHGRPRGWLSRAPPSRRTCRECLRPATCGRGPIEVALPSAACCGVPVHRHLKTV
jgi:thioredoxin reductase (NADPH)